jgi:formamidopyrimidine-DNA glycosylase
MPEGPEVLTLTNSLNNFLKDKTIVSIILEEKDYFNPKHLNLPLKIVSVKCKGKQIYFHLLPVTALDMLVQDEKEEKDHDVYLTNHLMMSGGWSLDSNGKYKKITFKLLNDNNEAEEIYFTDVRKFATFQILNKTGIDELLNSLEDGFVGDHIISLEKFRKNIKNIPRKGLTVALMDQRSICSEIGNYLLSEILFAARIHPDKKCKNLTDDDIKTLYDKAKEIIENSYKLKGVSIKDYVDLDGTKGKYQDYLQVYGKKTVKVEGIVFNIKNKSKNGRTVWFVEELQK